MGESEIDANLQNIHDYPKFVWTSLPVYRERAEYRREYTAMGRNDHDTEFREGCIAMTTPIVADSGNPAVFTVLQAGRGIAALLVVLFHTTLLFASKKYWGVKIGGGLFGFGYAGVEFFFVLSGFIILYAHERDIDNPRSVWRYLGKRFRRIYPIYWLITLALTAVVLMTRDFHRALIPNSFLLIGAHTGAVLAVAWTLFHEVLFYLIFAVLIVNFRVGLIAFGLWFIACIASLFGSVPHYSFAPLNLLFGFGMVAALASSRLRLQNWLWWAGIVGFGLVGVADVRFGFGATSPIIFAYGLAAAVFVAGGASAERAGRIAAPVALCRLGDASYVLYLIHYPILSVLAKFWHRVPSLASMAPAPTALLFVGICVFAAVVIHRWIERPLMALLAVRESPTTTRPCLTTTAVPPSAP